MGFWLFRSVQQSCKQVCSLANACLICTDQCITLGIDGKGTPMQFVFSFCRLVCLYTCLKLHTIFECPATHFLSAWKYYTICCCTCTLQEQLRCSFEAAALLPARLLQRNCVTARPCSYLCRIPMRQP